MLTSIWWSGGSRNFAKEVRVLKMRSRVASYQKVTATIDSNNQSWSSYEYTGNCWRTQRQSFYVYLALEANCKGEILISGCFMNWPKILKIVVLKYHLLLLYTTTMNHFLTGLWCAMKSGFYVTTSNDHLSSWTEKFQNTSPSPAGTKRWSWSLFGGLLPVWSTTAF